MLYVLVIDEHECLLLFSEFQNAQIHQRMDSQTKK